MLRVEQVHVIRHKVLVDCRSVRSVAREMRVSRNTVKKYLEQSEPKREETGPRPHPVLARVEERAHALLADARLTGGKQRWTAPRLQEVLAGEGLLASERTVRRCLSEWRRRHAEVFVPLAYLPGDLAEVDFFEVLVGPPEARRKAWMFLMRDMYGPEDFACLYDRQDQVCFLDGHVRAFEHFGKVPHRIVYDNLRAAVRKMMVGSDRELTARFAACASHYLFEPCFARARQGHDKGGVEGRGKGVRWRHLTPIPEGTDLEAISAALQTRLDAQAAEHGERVEESRRAMKPLPAWPFRPERVQFLPASGSARVRLDGAVYTVPEGWARSHVEVRVGAREVVFVRGAVRVTERRLRSGEKSVRYLHFLRELSHKPQALRQVAPLAQRQSDLSGDDNYT
jgi:transposase